MKTLIRVAVLLGTTAFATSSASAHISLLEPVARYDGSVANQSKACPCGVGESNRLCNVDGDRSDPDRSNNVTTLVAGSTITIQWDEYVGHTGRYRVAFDPDGADYDDFNANVLADLVDPAGSDGNTGNGSIWEVEITVPDTPCNNCTLQLIQRMDGDTVEPVGDTIDKSSYYQCADIVIVAPGDDVGSEMSDMGGPPDPTPDAGGEPDTDPSPGPPDLGGATPVDTGNDNAPGGDDAVNAPTSVDGSGSACSTTRPGSTTALIFLVALVMMRRRRRSSPC